MTYRRSIGERSRGGLGAIADAEGSLQSDTLVGLKQSPHVPCPTSTLVPCETVDVLEKLQVTRGAGFRQGEGRGTGISCTFMQLCEEGTASTPEPKGHNEELNDLFLPLPLPMLRLLNITGVCGTFFPLLSIDGRFPHLKCWWVSTVHEHLPCASTLSTVITTFPRRTIPDVPSQETYTRICDPSRSLGRRGNPTPLHGLNNLEAHQVIHPVAAVI